MLLLLFCCFDMSMIFAQDVSDISDAEYFIDTDPGAGNGIALTPGVSNNGIASFVASIATTGIAPGFHNLYIRAKNDDGWGLYESRMLYVSNDEGNVSDVTAAEFFIDNDPGTGNGQSLATGASSGGGVNFTAAISTATLAAGFHNLYIRSKNADGWGVYESRMFFVSNDEGNVSDITAAEFFIDNDPGAGKGQALSVGTSTAGSVNFIAAIPTTGLAAGFHNLYIRTKNADGWGVYESRMFYISNEEFNAGDITAAEFFIDNDPGVGKGQTLSVGSSSGGTVSFVAAIPTTGLAAGFHNLYIRTKNADGWGEYESRMFHVSFSEGEVSNITSAEYFIDTDPGVGNASPLNITTTGAIVTQTFVASVAPGLSPGTHFLFIRVQDASGNWSSFERDTFEISSDPLAASGIELSAKKTESNVSLHWYSVSNKDAIQYELERSSNGIDFRLLHTVKATKNNGGKTNYSHTDTQPFKGINFYRVRQINQDGSSVYSGIVTVLFSSTSDITLYPNPAHDVISITINGKVYEGMLQIFSSNGALVLSKMIDNNNQEINISHLAAGSYYVRISDGANLTTMKFNKQDH